MRVVEPLVHARSIERLWRAARERRLPHALFFEGPEGIGKFTAARWFAQGLLCERGPAAPCGHCGPCKRVLSGGERGNHPDLLVLDPADPALEQDFERSPAWKIHRIAYRPDAPDVDDPEYCVERFLALRPMEGGFRPVVIREAHRLNPQAQNALLKTLEEPRPWTLLVLETHRSALLLPTIKSRCVRMRFERPGTEECVRILLEHGIAPAAAPLLARMALGSPGRALEAARADWPGIRERLLAVLRGERTPLSVARELGELEGTSGAGTPLARERERLRVILDLTLGLLQDGLRSSAGTPAAALAHGDVADLAAALGEEELRARLQALLEARQDVELNLTPAALLDRALLALGRGVPILSR